MMTGDTKACNISWPSYHTKNQNDEKKVDISVLLPLFPKGLKSAAMIRHTMGVVKQAVNHVNPNQTSVIALDRCKQSQNRFNGIGAISIGKEKFVIMMGALHIEMAALKTLGMYSYFKETRY